VYSIADVSPKPIYSNDDLGHYWNPDAVLYCGLLLILLKSWLVNLQRRRQI